MNLNRHIPFRLLQRLVARQHIKIGHRTITVPLHNPAALAWLYWRETWKVEIIRRALGQRPGAFLDVGANVGQTLADFIACGVETRYIGFEPNLQCASFITEIAGVSGLTGVDVLPVGLWDLSSLQTLNIAINTSTDQTASLRTDFRSFVRRRPQWVWSSRLDELLPALGNPTVSLLKIDVEGAELEVLQGATSILERSPPPILCEVLLADGGADLTAYAQRVTALASLLKKYRYSIYRVMSDAHGCFQGLFATDAFPVEVWTSDRSEECDYIFAPIGWNLSASAS